MKLKESVKSALILMTFYLVIVGGLFMLAANNRRTDKKMTDMYNTQISQNQ